MESIPTWLGAIGTLIAIATALGAAVAVYRTSVQGTSLKNARETITDLRGEVSDHERRESKLENDVRLLETKLDSALARATVLEDLLTKRKDDDEIRAEIAAVRKVVDENVLSQLTGIMSALEAKTTVETSVLDQLTAIMSKLEERGQK